jgi:Uncharacterized conserved protein
VSHWLLKTEPSSFSIDDLERRPNQTEPWDGVRNYQARNFMRDTMRVGDTAFLYHSSCDEPAIVGIVEIASQAAPDPTQYIEGHHHHDPASRPEEPRWWLIDVRLRERLPRPITLQTLRAHAEELEGFALLARGNRLSVMPVSAAHWQRVLALAAMTP